MFIGVLILHVRDGAVSARHLVGNEAHVHVANSLRSLCWHYLKQSLLQTFDLSTTVTVPREPA
jgi:hypothetical protein